MPGHTDTVTGFKLSPDGSFLLSNAMDNTGMSFIIATTCLGINFTDMCDNHLICSMNLFLHKDNYYL